MNNYKYFMSINTAYFVVWFDVVSDIVYSVVLAQLVIA